MGKVYSHLSEEERQVIQIEVGNGTSVRKIARLLGRGPSGISREIRRNTWFPSNESESYRPYRPKRLKTGPWTGRYYIAGPAQHKADRRRAKPRKPYHLSCGRLWSRVAEWPGRGWSPLPVSGIIRRCLPKRTIIEPGMARELQEVALLNRQRGQKNKKFICGGRLAYVFLGKKKSPAAMQGFSNEAIREEENRLV